MQQHAPGGDAESPSCGHRTGPQAVLVPPPVVNAALASRFVSISGAESPFFRLHCYQRGRERVAFRK